ncbi:hypothetical protein BKA63DRAFT_569450 [Paraphoma chrysanthemicola]|nr:hypothetical protein BKA63DRAFT_569450 [Paraphoma chrysanthemicola]
MDDSPSQPAQRAGLNYQSYLDDYQPDYSDDFKVFGRTNVSIKSSESTNISPATIFVSTKLGRNRSTESNDSGYSSYSARTVSSADSSSVYDIVRPPPVPPTNPRKSSYRSSHGTRRVIRPLWRKRASNLRTSVHDGERRSISASRRPAVHTEIGRDPEFPRASYEVQTLSQDKTRKGRTPPHNEEDVDIDRKAIYRARSQLPRLEIEIEESVAAGKGKSRSKGLTFDPSHGEEGQVGGLSVTSTIDAVKSEHKTPKHTLSEHWKSYTIERGDGTAEMKYDAITQTSEEEPVHLEKAREPGPGRLSRDSVDHSSQVFSGRDVTVSTSLVRLLPELIPVDATPSSSSQHERLVSTSHTSTGQADTEVNQMSQLVLTLGGLTIEDCIAFNSAKRSEPLQLGGRKTSISSSETHLSQISSDDNSGSSGDNVEDSLELYEDSEEDFEESEITMKSALDTAMSVVKGLLLRELLDCALPDAIDSLGSPSSTSSRSQSNSAASSSSSNVSSNKSDSQRAPSGKRTRENRGDSGDTDGDESDKDDERPKKKSGKDPAERPIHGRLKCPFFQRQPERYTKAACRGRGFADMAKLKDHIKRVHTQPLRCSRCWLEMRSEDTYSEHLQQEEACTKNGEPQDDRIRPQMLKRLDFKKSPYTKARNVEEKWNMMFSAIFPDDTVVPSPFEQHGMSPRLEQALSKALEEELSRELAPIIEPIMARIKGLIPAIINNCRLELMRTSPISSEEEVYTPSTESYGEASSNGRLARYATHPKHRSVYTPPSSSGTASQLFDFPESVPTKTHYGILEMTGPSLAMNAVNTKDQGLTSLGNDTDMSMFYPDRLNGILCSQNENMGNYFDLDENGGLFSLPLNCASDASIPQVEGISAATSSLFDSSSIYVP